MHCRVSPKIQCPSSSPSSHFISHTFICGSGSQAACLEVPLRCSWSQLDAVVFVPSAQPALCSLFSQARLGSSCQVPWGGERPLKRRARSASLECWWLAESPTSPACCVLSDSCLQTPAPAVEGRQSCPENSKRGVRPSFFPVGKGYWGAASRLDTSGSIRANILQK